MLSFLDRARAELSDIEFSDEKKELLLQQYEQKKKEAVTLAKHAIREAPRCVRELFAPACGRSFQSSICPASSSPWSRSAHR